MLRGLAFGSRSCCKFFPPKILFWSFSMSLTILGGLFPVRTIVSTLSSMEWLGKGAFAPNHCTEGCPANEYPWFFGLSIPIPQRFEIVEPFVGQLIMQIFKREVKISNLYCCFRSISSPLLLSQTKFISNRKQCSTKKVRMPSSGHWRNYILALHFLWI